MPLTRLQQLKAAKQGVTLPITVKPAAVEQPVTVRSATHIERVLAAMQGGIKQLKLIAAATNLDIRHAGAAVDALLKKGLVVRLSRGFYEPVRSFGGKTAMSPPNVGKTDTSALAEVLTTAAGSNRPPISVVRFRYRSQQHRVMVAMKGGDFRRTETIADFAGLPTTQTCVALAELIRKGAVRRTGRGSYELVAGVTMDPT